MNRDQIELTGQFPEKAIKLSQQTAIEVYVTLTNNSGDTLTLDFSSGQTFDIYVYDETGQRVSQWSSDRMFTQAVQSVSIAPGDSQRFGGELELVDLDRQQLATGSYQLKFDIVGSITPAVSNIETNPLSLETKIQITD